MRVNLHQALLSASLLALVGCTGGGDSKAPTIVTGPASMPSTTTPLFDPANAKIPLPNILATATAPDPLTGAYTSHTTGAVIVGARPANTSMTPPEALAYVNAYEMGSTHAVSGLNSPIYIQFTAAVDATTVTAANVKVFQLTPDTAGTENAALGFSDISAMFTYRYTAGGTDLFLFPNFPLQPGTRYLYVVTNRVKDTAGLPISSSPYFEALKSTTALAGSFAALEPVRANAVSGTTILLSGYAKVFDDLITATATTTITKRADVTLMARFITTGAGAISLTTTSPSATGASLLPVESALRAFAAGAFNGIPGGLLAGKTWSNTITVTKTYDRGGTNQSPDVYWNAAAGTNAPATVGTIVLGTINSADLSIDPVVARANATTMDLTGVTLGGLPAYNPAAGVTQGFRASNMLMGFYHTNRAVPFLYIAPTAAAPSGGYPLVIYAHGIGRQKEDALAVAQSLTTINRAVVSIDQAMHGALAVTGHTTGAQWFQDFVALGAPLAFRANVHQSAFHLHRLELTVRFGGFAGLGSAAPVVGLTANIKFVGQSLGSIVGTYYLAGNTTLALTGAPYTQSTLNTDMKGYLADPGGRWGYIGQDTASVFEPTVTAGLAAVGVVKNTPTYHQFFLVTQAIGDPTDPATMTTPLASGLPSRLSGRVAMEEAVGDTYIPNPYARYFANALGGRAVLGTAAAAALAPGFKQLAYTAGGTPAHAAGVPAQFMYTIASGAVAPKFANAAVAPSDLTPTEGYFQFDQTGVNHGSLIDPSNLTNLGLIQRQMRYFMGATGTSIVVDPTQGAALPIAPVPFAEVQFREKFPVFGY